jgi:hypothetical protein
MQTVADWNIDQAILAGDGNRGLRSVSCERKQAAALSAAKNERENFVVHGTAKSKSYTCRRSSRFGGARPPGENGSATIRRFCREDDWRFG